MCPDTGFLAVSRADGTGGYFVMRLRNSDSTGVFIRETRRRGFFVVKPKAAQYAGRVKCFAGSRTGCLFTQGAAKQLRTCYTSFKHFSLPITRICGTKRRTCNYSQMSGASYSIVRMSEKPVTSKISMIVSLTWTTFISPCLFMIFWAESSTRSPAEEM